MKTIVKAQDLSNAVSKVVKAVSTKTPNQLLEGIKIVCKGDELILTATDMEIAIEKVIKCESFMEGEAVIPGRIFADFTKKLENEDDIELTVDHAKALPGIADRRSVDTVEQVVCSRIGHGIVEGQRGVRIGEVPFVEDQHTIADSDVRGVDGILRMASSHSKQEQQAKNDEMEFFHYLVFKILCMDRLLAAMTCATYIPSGSEDRSREGVSEYSSCCPVSA